MFHYKSILFTFIKLQSSCNLFCFFFLFFANRISNRNVCGFPNRNPPCSSVNEKIWHVTNRRGAFSGRDKYYERSIVSRWKAELTIRVSVKDIESGREIVDWSEVKRSDNWEESIPTCTRAFTRSPNQN